MYFASIKPIMDLSRDVIDSAIAGDIAAAEKSSIVLEPCALVCGGVCKVTNSKLPSGCPLRWGCGLLLMRVSCQKT